MIKDIPMQEYREAEGLSNHELQLFKKNPATYIWNKKAPSDNNKVGTTDKGTALHALLLEPETYDDLIIVSDVKGRDTKSFKKAQFENPDNIVLTEIEAEQVRIMADGAKHDPMFNAILESDGKCEASIFVTDPETGLKLKIRPDKVCYTKGGVLLTDVKTTKDIDDWRSEQRWKNPLFSMGYGFTAAFYLYVASIHFKSELTAYYFNVVQTSACLGKYPVSVFKITKDELIHYGFWQEMLDSLQEFEVRHNTNNFMTYEQFPNFYVEFDSDNDVEITLMEDQ